MSRALLESLISVGKRGVAEVPELLREKDRAWQLVMCGNDPWKEAGDALDEGDLECLIQGLVLYARVSGWSGGSVSPVIVLHRLWEARFTAACSTLTEWTLQNRTNDPEPFGYWVPMELNSLVAIDDWRQIRAESRAARHVQEHERCEADRHRTSERATARLFNAVKRGDLLAVEALLARGADPGLIAVGGLSLAAYAEAEGKATIAALLRSHASPAAQESSE